MWLYYWLASVGVNPMKDAKVITVPPPQMVANMRVGNMDDLLRASPETRRHHRRHRHHRYHHAGHRPPEALGATVVRPRTPTPAAP